MTRARQQLSIYAFFEILDLRTKLTNLTRVNSARRLIKVLAHLKNMADYGASDIAGTVPDAQNGVHDDDAVNAEKAAKIQKALDAGWVATTAYDYAALRNNDNTDWDGNARIYEWDGEAGDVGPELPELELELFGATANANERNHAGIDFSK